MQLCLKTGEVKRWCATMPESVPKDFAPLVENFKIAQINTFPVHTEDGYIWVALAA